MSETVTSPPVAPASPPAPEQSRRDLGRWARIVGWVVLLVVLLALPLYIGPGLQSAGQYMMIGAVGAIGLTLLIGQAGQLSLAHAFFLLVGGTTYTVLAGESEDTGVESLLGLGLPTEIALLGAVVVTGLTGLAFAPVAARLRGIYLGVASLALVFLGFYLGAALPALTGGAASGRTPENFSLFGFSFSNEGYLAVFGVQFRESERLWYLFLALTVISYVLARGAVHSRVGRSWRAVRDNEAAAAVMGVDVVRTKAAAFAVSAAYAGLAGVMVVLWYGLLKPDESEFGVYGLNTSIAFLAMAIIGGLGSVPGAVVGGAIVYGTGQILNIYAAELGLGSALSGWSPTVIGLYIYGIAVILVVLFEPGGLAAIGRRVTGLVSRRLPQNSTGAPAHRSAPPREDGS